MSVNWRLDQSFEFSSVRLLAPPVADAVSYFCNKSASRRVVLWGSPISLRTLGSGVDLTTRWCQTPKSSHGIVFDPQRVMGWVSGTP